MTTGGETLRCVIVDDNPGFREAAANLLGRQGISVVGLAANGAEALACVARERPDVTIVDVHLGAEDGLRLAEQLVNDAGAPVILTSTRAEHELAELIAQSPALGFVSKVELSPAAIRRLLGR